MIELLTEEEKNAIDAARRYYVDFKSVDDMCKVESLLIPWQREKSSRLFSLLGKNLILKKKVVYEISEEEIKSEINKLIANHPFPENYNKIVASNYDSLHSHEWYEAFWLSSSAYLVDNIYMGRTFEIPLPNGKKYRVQKGCKVLKALQKISSAFNISDFEDFRIKHSQILNQRKLEGNLCLSIHPLDYITMSDNDCGWESCMSWTEDGDYKLGTVEMMNSSCVLVAYLESEDSKYKLPNDFEWSNKKWRELYVVNEQVLINILGYPYCNDSLSKEVLNWIKYLAETNWNISYDSELFRYDSKKELIENTHIQLSFYTNNMYNDFRGIHYCYLNKNIVSLEDKFVYNYSGPAQCMICGKIDVDFQTEKCLSCLECSGAKFCCSCHDYYDESELIFHNGHWYCEGCFSELFEYCYFCEEYDFYEDSKEIFIIDENDELIEGINVFRACPCCFESEFKNYTVKKNLSSIPWSNKVLTISINDISEENREIINRYGYSY
jgi:hypothetical protein